MQFSMVRATSAQGACQKEQMTNFESEHLAFQATAKLDAPEFQRNFYSRLVKAAVLLSPMRVAVQHLKSPFLGKDNPAIGTLLRAIHALKTSADARPPRTHARTGGVPKTNCRHALPQPVGTAPNLSRCHSVWS